VARRRELLGAVALTAAVDFGFFRAHLAAPGGTALGITFMVLPIVLLASARRFRITTRLVLMLLVLLLVAARSVFAPNPGTVLLGVAATFAAAVAMRHRRAFLTDVCASLGCTLGSMHRRVWSGVAGAMQLVSGRGGGRRSLLPVVVPVVLVSAFAGIFALANPLVGKWMGAAFHALSYPTAPRVALWASMLGASMLLLRPAVFRWSAAETADNSSESTKVARSVAMNTLGALNVLFLLYNALDVTYLWAGSPPPGISEREYAHQGAAWLTAAMALLTIVVGVFFRDSLAHDPRAKKARWLAFAWLAQGAVLALGTFRRLGIHISTSGLSSIRILGMVGTALVVVGLLQVGYKLFAGNSFAWLLRRQLDALAVAAALFTLAPTHWLSARINAVRIMEHRYQALVHAEEEVHEAESVAQFLPLLNHDDERIRKGMAALLLNERDSLRERANSRGFRDQDMASTRALGTLDAAAGELKATLGDVARAEAILYFEYIRNSSIEGDIAESEISKVPFAKSRADKLATSWLGDRGLVGGGHIGYAPVVNMDGVMRTSGEIIEAQERALPAMEERNTRFTDARLLAQVPTPREDWRQMRFSMLETRNGRAQRREVTVVFQRAQEETCSWALEESCWRVVEEHGSGLAFDRSIAAGPR
jgi:hypothetical protein